MREEVHPRQSLAVQGVKVPIAKSCRELHGLVVDHGGHVELGGVAKALGLEVVKPPRIAGHAGPDPPMVLAAVPSGNSTPAFEFAPVDYRPRRSPLGRAACRAIAAARSVGSVTG